MREVYTVSSEQEEEGCAGAGGCWWRKFPGGALCVLGKGPGYQEKETIKTDSGV